VEVVLTNNGDRTIDEVAQAYIATPTAGKGSPMASLVGFRRVSIPPKSSVKAVFKIVPERLMTIQSDGSSKLLKGNYTLTIGGAAPLAKQTIDDFKVKFPHARLVEGYGLSECSPVVAANLYDKQKSLSVGPALEGYEVKIVNDEMIEVGTGEIGEIIVKGDCVMQGYFGMPNITDETIINGWLKTGDLGKVDDEGFIYIVDRKKDLIISKGINIYPREIEEVLYKLEEVEAAAVIGIKDEHADEEVAAFIQLKDGMDLDEKQVRDYLKKHLANFKIPKSIYFAEQLPRNATGKVLKRVLKEQVKDKI
ncbi:MAG: AMP-binding protein, partial [Campylobacter curvus]